MAFSWIRDDVVGFHGVAAKNEEEDCGQQPHHAKCGEDVRRGPQDRRHEDPPVKAQDRKLDGGDCTKKEELRDVYELEERNAR